MWEPPTGASGFGSSGYGATWPTPHGIGRDGHGSELSMAVAVSVGQSDSERTRAMWPTPKASPSGPDYARVDRPRSGGDDLATAVARTMFPTPTRGDGKASGSRNTPGSNAHGGMSLTDAVRGDGGTGRMWATPTHHEPRLGFQDRTSGKKGRQKSLTTEVIEEAGGRSAIRGQLNPEWVEWLMGFPDGWTDCGHSEMQSCPRTLK